MRSNILHRVLLEHFTKKASSGSISALNVVLQAGCVLLLLNSSIKDTFLPRLHLEIVAILLFNIICLANPACCFLVFPIVRRKIKILYSCNVMSLGGRRIYFLRHPSQTCCKDYSNAETYLSFQRCSAGVSEAIKFIWWALWMECAPSWKPDLRASLSFWHKCDLLQSDVNKSLKNSQYTKVQQGYCPSYEQHFSWHGKSSSYFQKNNTIICQVYWEKSQVGMSTIVILCK